MRFVLTKDEDALVLNEDEFRALVIEALADYLSKWSFYFEDYVEMLIDSYDVDRVEVSVGGKGYVVRSEREFVKLVKKVFPDLERKLVDFLKKEL